ncbi:thioredoxin family protein [Aromatoleum evansii]|uniref:Thioredoxin family protein n=1 Tax=Aromatoleum evansii TaxID=59406 RepID=A0ABZ1AEQ3_AROEV|nr:thioredoxin family protein [Aromatoleum evansii]NMG31591.1 thioredoxin [Aromatoleum evansii]WRL44339.1 thioredoxin family protein [Aromatoleum evansii]
MGLNAEYSPVAPERKDVDALKDATVLEFGTGWCGFCRGAQPLIAEAFAAYPQVRHLKIEDGPGRPLGRSFRVKLWPTLVFLRDGVEVARIVRPGSAAEITEALRELQTAPAKE